MKLGRPPVGELPEHHPNSHSIQNGETSQWNRTVPSASLFNKPGEGSTYGSLAKSEVRANAEDSVASLSSGKPIWPSAHFQTLHFLGPNYYVNNS